MVFVLPDLLRRAEAGRDLPLLRWRFDAPMLAISSGPLGGGIGVRHWVLNVTVPMSYNRDDPDVHLRELAGEFGLEGPGLGLLTGVDVGGYAAPEVGGVRVVATVGVGEPEWASAPHIPGPTRTVGTINIVGYLPVRLCDAALVNAVGTVTEAKAQALWELGYPGTGTATDATCVICPLDGPVERYGGPRSTWGAQLARAAHAAVLAGDGNALKSAPDQAGSGAICSPGVSPPRSTSGGMLST